MLANEPRLYFENVRYNIENILYKSIKTSQSANKLSVKITDAFTIEEINTKKIVVVVKRSIKFKPRSLFTLGIEIKMTLHLNQNDKKFRGTPEELNSYALENMDSIINRSNLMETVSLLIGQISSAYGNVPIITPPSYINDND